MNSFQSFRNDGFLFREAKDEPTKRLKFSAASVSFIIHEKYATDTIEDSGKFRQTENAYQKLSDEEVSKLHKAINTHWAISYNMKKIDEESIDI